MFDGNAMAAEVIKTVREFVAKATEPLLARISELEAQVKALPIQITAAKESVRVMVADETAKAVAATRPEVDYTKVWSGCSDLIAQQLAALPRAVDGKDADTEVVRTIVAEEAAKAVSALPKPKDAEVDYALIAKNIAVEVDAKVAAIEIPKPEPVDYDRIGKAIEEVVATLPPAKDGEPGKDVDPAALDELRDLATAALKAGNDAGAFALCAANTARAEIDELKARPISPASFMLDDSGDLVAVYPDGETKAVGNVRGKDGARGASIMDGSVDDDGQLVLRMSDGRVINAGIVKGKDGADAEGKRGKPGRDASEIRVLPAIDEAESYPEGTYACYRGGEIRAERATDPIVDGDVIKSGWRIAREGIAEESEQTLKEGRIIERTTVYTSGRTFARSIVTHAQIGRGVYKAGTEYDQCDVVTWDGSQWQCEHATKAEPGNGNDWRLIVKRGTPGKDAQTIKGDPGPPGRPGRDLTQLGPNGMKY